MTEENLPKILIGVPNLDSIKTDTVASLFSGTFNLNAVARLHIQNSSLVHDARNKIVAEALASGQDYVMFIDSDISFPSHAIQKLIDANKDIIGGLYYRKQPPHLPTIAMKNGDNLTIPQNFPKKEPFKVFGVGTGFLLIKTSVFKKLTPPYFYFGNLHGKPIGEDMYFCHKAYQAKFEVWCDPTLKLGHVGTYVYTEEDYNAYKEDVSSERQDPWADGAI